MTTKLNKFVNENKSLFWDVRDIDSLSELAIEERILKYGNWKNVLELGNIFGKETFRNYYLQIKSKNRNDLSPKTINFFNLYLNV